MFLTAAADARAAVGAVHGELLGHVRPAATMVVVAGVAGPRLEGGDRSRGGAALIGRLGVGIVGPWSVPTPSWWGRGPTDLPPRSRWPGPGHRVEVYEGAPTVGGGTRTEELTLEGFRHDVCAAVHPTLVASPFFRSLDLAALGVVLRQPEVPFAHPLGGGRAAALYRGVGDTASHLGGDAAAYRDLVGPLVDWLDRIVDYVLSPMRSLPRDPLTLARFALVGTPSVRHATRGFTTDAARALLAGAAAHSMQELTAPLTSAFGLLLTALGHGVGWPVVEGGARPSRRGWPARCGASAV